MKASISALYSVGTEKIAGKFFRYVRTRYAHEPLSMVGAFKDGRRYNVSGLFGALYLGFNRETCEAEVSQGIAAGVPFKKDAYTVWTYDVALGAVVRLTIQLCLVPSGLANRTSQLRAITGRRVESVSRYTIEATLKDWLLRRRKSLPESV